jgi:hypothetical protein
MATRTRAVRSSSRGARIRAPWIGLVALLIVVLIATFVPGVFDQLSGSASPNAGSSQTWSGDEAAGGEVAPTTAPTAPRTATPALDLLATLEVKGRAPKTGYDRVARFGAAWYDVDGNGCGTRDDVLRRDLTDIVVSGACKVMSGELDDPYTGKVIDFVRGVDTSDAVQIDHVVALSNAWQTGAQQLDYAQRVSLANDPINLTAVDGPTNQAKGDSDAATWLPPSTADRCDYAARQVGVKAAYALWVTPAERDALEGILESCGRIDAPVSEFAG